MSAADMNSSVNSRKVLSEFVFKCGSLFWAFLCCLLFLFPAAVKLLERMKNNVKEDEVIKDADQDNETVHMIFPAEKQSPSSSPPEFTFSFLRRELGNSGTEVKSPVTTFTTNSNRYQFVSGCKDVCGFMEEAETIRGLFVVEEMFLNSTDSSEFNSPTGDEFSHQSGFIDDFFHLREESCDDDEEEEADDDLSETLELKQNAENYTVDEEEEMSDENDMNFLEFVPRKDIISFSSTLDLKINQFHDIQNTQIIQTSSSSDDDDDDYIEMEPYSPDSINPNEEGFKGGKLSQPMKEEEQEEIENKTWESDANNNNNVVEDDDDEEEFDILLEHQNLVKQMKKEVKNSSKVKGGLPTICEDGECAILKDLKPLKLEDNKFEYKDLMQEIRKFYKSYADKMKKLDILNYQTLQAISILQLKDCDKLFKQQNKKASIPNFLSFKERKVYADMTLKSNINDLHRDLELVYVGQVCLSWEILRWQYGKLMQLQQQHDDHSRRQYSYNQVASEFQQFQVLLQRFVEDERFRPPRIHNYVESRRFCHALLHVPLIKDDGREKKDRLKEVDDSISVAKLVDIVKESMEAFWEFVRADKDENHTVVSKGCLPHLHLLHDDDPELVINIKASLEKKERKLKLIHKAGNCIVKMFQKVPDDNQQHSCEMIMAQVELKLISRVLSLPRWTTDQLRWCERKLNCINIVNRRIYMEPCFSLFPC